MNALAVTAPRSMDFDLARFEMSLKIAEVIAGASVLPDHLRLDKSKRELPAETIKANCVLVVNQALRWGVDPFSIAPETYVVGGKLGYSGKLVLSVINSRAGLEENMRFEAQGSGEELSVVGTATIAGEKSPRSATVKLSDAKTGVDGKSGKVLYRNEMYTKDPEQKLCYDAAIKWARRHCPEVLLGVVTDSPMDVEPENFDDGATLESTAVNARRLAASVDRPAQQPVKAITAGPIKHDELFQSYRARIKDCQKQDDLSRLVDKIQSEPDQLLNSMDRSVLVDEARNHWRDLSRSADDQQERGEQGATKEASPQGSIEEATGDELGSQEDQVFTEYHAAIMESEDLGYVSGLIDRIDRDERLSITSRKDLGKLINERSAQLRKAAG